MKKLTKIQASARGQDCTLQIAGVCNYDTETTVLCHFGFGDDGSAKRLRPNERNAAYGCSACHEWIGNGNDYFYIARALVRTTERRDELGL